MAADLKLSSFLILLLPVLLIPSPLHAASVFPFKRHAAATHLVHAAGADSSPQPDRYVSPSDLVQMRYHMGPVLSVRPLNLYVLWYGDWPSSLRQPLRDFLASLSDDSVPSPSVAQWWSTVALYGDQTNANVSRAVSLAGEADDPTASLGISLTRLDVQRVIAAALADGRLPVDSRGGAYIVFTSAEVSVQDFCRAVCGFHYFTFPSLTGHTLPFAWVGNSGKQCPDVCAYPFVLPSYMSHASGVTALRPPNGDFGVDGMVSVVAHEIAEMSTNPLVNSWYAGDDPTAPTEIADLCEGVYGTGSGGGYAGQVSTDGDGRSFNVLGRGGRQFLIQWVWSPLLSACTGPNKVN